MKLLTIPEAAEQLRCDRRTVYRLLDEMKLPKVKFGRCARIRQDDLDAFIDKHTENRVYGDKSFPRFHYVPGMKVV